MVKVWFKTCNGFCFRSFHSQDIQTFAIFFFLFFLDYPDSKGDMKVESDAIFGITQKTAFY